MACRLRFQQLELFVPKGDAQCSSPLVAIRSLVGSPWPSGVEPRALLCREMPRDWRATDGNSGADPKCGFCDGAIALTKCLTHVLTEGANGNRWSADRTSCLRACCPCMVK
jgi:hypothetical protein